ncbi:MAG: hypothetical protein AAF385_17135, partial [Pseudomonadota bacterium]
MVSFDRSSHANIDVSNLLQPGGDYLTYLPEPAPRGALLVANADSAALRNGKTLFYRDWLAAGGPQGPLAGPKFDATDCATCHIETATTNLAEPVRVYRTTSGKDADRLGWQVNAEHIDPAGTRPTINVQYKEHEIALADGALVHLRTPVATTVNAGRDVQLALRAPPPLFGWG